VSLALVYACTQQASDSVGVTVGSSIDVAHHDGTDGGPDAAADTDVPHSRADDRAPGDVAPDLGVVVPDPAGSDPGTLDVPDDAAPPATDPAAPPSTEPPTAVDLVVDEITVPSTSASTVDGCGDPLSFADRQMIDGVESTAWRMDGDGTGVTVVLRLKGPRRVLSVGLIPGFDAVDPCNGTDHFATGRRLTNVTWEFDGGKRFEQKLINVATLQRIDVDATTSRIELHIDGVSADPQDDFTAVSELVVRGV
jgi:hypothetical protein